MSPQKQTLSILGAPYRSRDGYVAPVQHAEAVDPDGVVRGLASWLEGLAESLSNGPVELVAEAVGTLRRGSARFSALAA